MKKRKIKLFASVASLAMVAAVMGVGVWAASQQGVNISSQIGFTGSAIGASVALEVSTSETLTKATWNGSKTAAEITAGTKNNVDVSSSAVIRDFEVTDDKATPDSTLVIALADGADNDGMFTKGSTITYTFTITPDTGVSTNIQYDVTVTGTIQGFEYQINELAKNTPATDVTGNTLTITFTATQNHATIESVADNFYDVAIAFENVPSGT